MLAGQNPQTAEEYGQITSSSEAVLADYQKWYQLLSHWNQKINLVSSQTIDQFWSRHALDSHQLIEQIPKGAHCLDMGSGGGFPAIAIAIHQKHSRTDNSTQDNTGDKNLMTMVETNGKKCNFLRAVSRDLNLGAKILQMRVEDIKKHQDNHQANDKANHQAGEKIAPIDIITARAFAPLDKLLHHCHPLWQDNTTAIFHKGRAWQSEIETAEKNWEFEYTIKDSKTDADAKIITVTTLHQKITSQTCQ